MAISEKSGRLQYTATSGQTVFLLDFLFNNNDEVKVYKRSSSTTPSSADLLTITSDYTLSGSGTGSGTVTLVQPATAGDIITIEQEIPIQFSTTFPENGTIASLTLQEVSEFVVRICRQLNTQNTIKTPTYPSSSVLGTKDQVLPTLSASQAWKMNAAGTLIEAADDPEVNGFSTLRSELASTVSGSEGSDLVGHDSSVNGATTVHNELNYLVDENRLFTTADIKSTHKTTADPGWIMWNNGSIGNASSGATNRANSDTQALFVHYWNTLTDTICPVSSGRGASALADFNANKSLSLPPVEGAVLAIAGQASNNFRWDENFTVTASSETMTASAVPNWIYSIQKVQVESTGTLPSPLATATDYYLIYNGTGVSGFRMATSTANAPAGPYITFTDTGSGTHKFTVQHANKTLGTYEGQQEHYMSREQMARMVAHGHSGNYDRTNNISIEVGGPGPYTAASGNTLEPGLGATALSLSLYQDTEAESAAVNVTQLTSYVNAMIKL